ncbi:diguanylate cyclase (GGDEF)-like protein [Devosia subaequoris]|uniref:Diguanylate cyclase (GGDEF)-like protein n=1 Tax=Devosia subaequoris TaxID=395930 RepID=A0A7W6NCU6_9HYPH|nr:diguanylate cyclase (GGDEF)-like protein [Devosia subaequoris]MCP1210529.1 GGDEF domain-containing protein [Devosia subaequoris]
MGAKINKFSTLPDSDPAKALAPIRRLVVGAFVGALVAGAVLIGSTLHVMETTDSLSMVKERARAAQVADTLVTLPESQVEPALERLGEVAGLRNLALSPSAAAGEYQQSLPLLSGPLGSHFLTWTAERPGLHLFNTHAPLRVPLMLVLIGSVLACLVAMLGHVRRIERQRIAAQRQALRDHLTGLPNRLALEGELSRLADGDWSFSVLAFDLDRFKPVNDLFGHHAGDLALIEVAQRLAAQLLPGEFLARIGGDEFVAIVHRHHRSDLIHLARDCIAAIGAPLTSVGRNVSVGVSLGIVQDGLGQTPTDLLRQADRALYEAKRQDGGTFCFAGEVRPKPREGLASNSPLPASLAQSA